MYNLGCMRTRRLISILCVVLACGVLAAPAWAAEDYTAPEIDSTPPWPAILFTVVFVVAACAVAFKSSNRTHLD